MNYEKLPIDYKKTFSRYTNLMKFIGIDFFSNSTNSRIRLFMFNIIFIPFIFGQFTLITKITSDNFLDGARSVPVSVMCVLDVIKMSIAVIKRKEIKQIFLEIGELWPTGLTADDEKSVVMKSWIRRMRVLLDGFYMYALVNLTIFLVIPLLITLHNIYAGVDQYVFPFLLVDLWEVNSIGSFIVTYIWELSATVSCQLCLYLPYDLLIVTITSDVSILLRLLRIDLENAVQTHGDYTIRKKNLRVSDPDSCERIFRIVKDHQKLLRIADQLSNIFGLVIFIHVAFSAIVICFFAFLTVVFGGLAETIANLISVFNIVITIFLLALSGQLLSDTSSSVADGAYQSSWYESDMKVKKLVLFIIIRSQKASYLSALGFSNMTLASFSKIMSSSWTYFSLLLQMYAED